jgi:fructose-1-phosphate kinase PfkB-like protein
MRTQGPSNAGAVAAAQMELGALSKGVSKALNKFVGNRSGNPLTISTLDKVQGRFWSQENDDQLAGIRLMNELWKASHPAVTAVIEAQLEKPRVRNNNSAKTPVIGSTREGLDIVIGFSAEGGPVSGGKGKGGKLEAVSLDVNPGGSSINVARALTNFGTPFELVGIVGLGDVGRQFLKALEKEGIKTDDLFRVSEDTRIHFSTAVNGNEYWLVSRSPKLGGTEIDQFTDILIGACAKNEKEILTLANSPPNGGNEVYMPEIIEETQDKHGMFVIYDPKFRAVSPGEMHAILWKGPAMIKPNLSELGQIVNVDAEMLRNDRDLLIHMAQQMLKQYGIKMALVSMDKDGAMLIDKKRVVHAPVPPIKVASPGCAGDTGIAAMIDITKKRDFTPEKLTDSQFKRVLGAFIAGGAATAAKPGSNIATLSEMQELEKDIKPTFV